MCTVSSRFPTPISATPAGISTISTVSSSSVIPGSVTPPAGATAGFPRKISFCRNLSLLGSFGISCGNNQFFLYGSHAFQHFLLGKMEHDDTVCYVLAVPGIYEERERLLANLFGFPYFKSARAKDAQPGHFGYWYRTIHTEPRNSEPISPESPPAESFSEESAENSPAARASRT